MTDTHAPIRNARPAGLKRRTLLGAGLLAGLSGHARAEPGAVVDENIAGVVDAGAPVETLFEGGRWCEGPVWVPRLGGLVFSDVRRNQMWRLVPGRPPAIFRKPSANANGNTLDHAGRLITCEHRTGRVMRAEADGRLTVLADRFEGGRLNSPNDVVVSRDGAIWFTDPTYGIENPEEGEPRASEQRGHFVFRLDPQGRLSVAADGFEQPNGLAFAPDERTLYVSDSSGAADPDGRRDILAFEVAEGRLARQRVFASLEQGAPDGLKTDIEGRLYAGTGDGVRIWGADGVFLGRIATPGPCANIAFGGSDGRRLFICAGERVLAVDVKVRGAGLRG